MGISCILSQNEKILICLEYEVHHHLLQIPIPMLEKKIWIQQENSYEITLTNAQKTLILQQLLGKY